MESSEKKPPIEATAIGKVRLATDCVMLSAVEKATLIQLAMHCFDHPDTTEIGPKQMAINASLGERVVRDALRTLRQLGLITVKQRPSPLTSLKRINWTALKIWRRVDPRRESWLAFQADSDESTSATTTVDDDQAEEKDVRAVTWISPDCPSVQ